MTRRPQKPEDLFSEYPAHLPETLANLDAVPIRECGEPLVDLRHACPRVFTGGRPLFARRSVAERLNIGQGWLNAKAPGFRLRIGEAWRAPGRQALYSRIARLIARLLHPFWPVALVREAAAKYVADPDALAPPPHTTGGAVDVGLLTPDGRRANMGPFTLAAARADYARLSDTARYNRAALRAAMEAAGFSNYEEEWWHWSYGDSGWALRTGQPAALYGAAKPEIDS